MDLSVIIVNYKSQEKVLKCLDALTAADWGDLTHEIIVVDNNSGDDLAQIKEIFPEVKIIRSEKNLGMGGGNNLGAKNSSGQFILILNPDTAVQKDAVVKLHQHLRENKQAGIVGPKLLNPDGTLQYSCLRFPKLHTPILRRTFFGELAGKQLDAFLMKDFDHASTKVVDWLMGSCFLIRREIMDKDGHIFDEKYFMYFEDTDLCRRVRERHNYDVVYHPEAVVIHDHARQSAESPWYIAPFTDALAREHIKSWARYFFG
jgi:N-acetylglucosaminyl-diphospho-decaprenol L-rhamnosyltransferase